MIVNARELQPDAVARQPVVEFDQAIERGTVEVGAFLKTEY